MEFEYMLLGLLSGLSVKGSTFTLGVLLGELLYRLFLLIQQVISSYDISRDDYFKIDMKKIFSIYELYLICTAMLQNFNSNTSNIIPAAVVWNIMRSFDCFENIYEKILVKNSSYRDIGAIVGANYWFGYLQTVLNVDKYVKQELEKYRVRLAIELHKNVEELSIEICEKLIILLPNDCEMNIGDLKGYNLFECKLHENGLPQKFEFECKHVSNQKSSIKQGIHWIYRNPEDEIHGDDLKNEFKKVLITVSFPNMLKTSCDIQNNIKVSEQIVQSFRNTIEQFKKGSEVKFLSFNKEDKLSSLIRENI